MMSKFKEKLGSRKGGCFEKVLFDLRDPKNALFLIDDGIRVEMTGFCFEGKRLCASVSEGILFAEILYAHWLQRVAYPHFKGDDESFEGKITAEQKVIEYNSDGFPTEVTLKNIENWKDDYEELMDSIGEQWVSSQKYWRKEENEKSISYRISVDDCPGNEAVIRALENNKVFWEKCWRFSQKGGHYDFEVEKSEV